MMKRKIVLLCGLLCVLFLENSQCRMSRVSLRNEGDKFLDDITVEELSEALKVPVIPVESDGYKLLETIIDGGV